MNTKIAIVMLAILATSAPAANSGEAEFNSYWHDGKAELDGYKLTVSRYGEEREGTAVAIYVTEPFSESKRVKVDDANANPGDTFNVLKLNMVRDFQTGIYDYNTMTSVFSRTADFSPAKITFSSAEWCGHVYEELRFDRNKISGRYYSYFENESGPRNVEAVGGGISEDNLFILLRGLKGDYLEPEEVRTIKLLSSLYSGRLAHRPPTWVSAEIKREKKTKKIKVPAGRFETMIYRIETDDGRASAFYVEKDYPHRIIRWEMAPDVVAELTGSERLQYWNLNGNGNESYLKKLGL